MSEWFPGGGAELAALEEARGAASAEVEIASYQLRRLDPEGSDVNLVLVFRAGQPPVARPLPYRVRLAWTRDGWRIASFARR